MPGEVGTRAIGELVDVVQTNPMSGRELVRTVIRPAWDNFVGLFHAVDQGNGPLNIPRYNGGLFARDDQLESLIVADEVCEHFAKLAADSIGPQFDFRSF